MYPNIQMYTDYIYEYYEYKMYIYKMYTKCLYTKCTPHFGKLLYPKCIKIKRLSYQFLPFKDLYIQTNLHNKFLKKLYKTI